MNSGKIKIDIHYTVQIFNITVCLMKLIIRSSKTKNVGERYMKRTCIKRGNSSYRLVITSPKFCCMAISTSTLSSLISSLYHFQICGGMLLKLFWHLNTFFSIFSNLLCIIVHSWTCSFALYIIDRWFN